MSGIIKVRATCGSFLRLARTQNVQVRFGVANGLEASSNTTSAKPHEFFDHTRRQRSFCGPQGAYPWEEDAFFRPACRVGAAEDVA